MVDVADLEGAVSMAWRGRLQLEIERCVGIGCAPALPLERLFEDRARSHGRAECYVARRNDAVVVALSLQRRPGGDHRLLLEILVVGVDKLSEQLL